MLYHRRLAYFFKRGCQAFRVACELRACCVGQILAKILIKKGLVTERNEENKKVFIVDNIENIKELLNDRIKSLENEKKQFELSLPSLLQKVAFLEPQIKFYSGKEAMKQVMNHIMLNRNIETELFWPMSEMMKILGPEYLEELNKKRIQRNMAFGAKC